jgi:hypothetical protein
MTAPRPTFCFIVLALMSAYVIEAQTQEECRCNGARQDRFSDGDDRLQWTFETYELVRHTLHPKYCYFKNVLNRSARDIVKVKWEAADYFRERIPSHKASPACIPQEGHMNPVETRGKLRHGLAGDYETKVRQPEDGWSKEEEKEKKHGAIDQEQQPETITAELQIYGNEKSWAHLRISSSASRAGGTKSTLSYEVKNTGNMEVAVLTNIPIVPSMIREVSMVQTPVPVSAGNYQFFKSVIDEEFEMRSAAIVIFDKAGDKILGADSIGVYAPISGKRLRSDKELWEKVFK